MLRHTSSKCHYMFLRLVPLAREFYVKLSKPSPRHRWGHYAAPKMFPSFNKCRKDMTNGESRVAKQLLDKCADDAILWYDVPVGNKGMHPDFILLDPKRGIMVLEVKDNHLPNVIKADKKVWEINTPTGHKTKTNPLEQARKNAFVVKEELEKEPQLLNKQGNLIIPWAYGVVFSNINRENLEGTALGKTVDAKKTICKDEMWGNVTNANFQARLDNMFEYKLRSEFTLSQREVDLIRYQIFPEYRIPQTQRSTIPPNKQPISVMDLQQEQFARNIGSGHRVIHGVAGSGKTILILHRARQLAENSNGSGKPILILCYNKPLANFLSAEVKVNTVQVCHFHKWCRDQLVAYKLPLPNNNLSVEEKMKDMVHRVIEGVKQKKIARQQYTAILIDEAHDFEPEWLRLMTKDMLDCTTNDLLVVYDDAQNIYRKRESQKRFSFKSVGIEARGRTTIFRVNYRNTKQILDTVLSVDDANVLEERTSHDEDGIPQVRPVASVREGDLPRLIRANCLQEEIMEIGNCFRKSKEEGYEWLDMAALCRNKRHMELCTKILTELKIPNETRTPAGTFIPQSNAVKILTMHACKGLQFPMVAMVGVGEMKNSEDEIKLFNVAGTRAMDRLFLGISGNGPFSTKLLGLEN